MMTTVNLTAERMAKPVLLLALLGTAGLLILAAATIVDGYVAFQPFWIGVDNASRLYSEAHALNSWCPIWFWLFLGALSPQLPAFGIGIIARHTRWGRAALIVSLIAFALAAICFLPNPHYHDVDYPGFEG